MMNIAVTLPTVTVMDSAGNVHHSMFAFDAHGLCIGAIHEDPDLMRDNAADIPIYHDGDGWEE